jgi:hypothetical protein
MQSLDAFDVINKVQTMQLVARYLTLSTKFSDLVIVW